LVTKRTKVVSGVGLALLFFVFMSNQEKKSNEKRVSSGKEGKKGKGDIGKRNKKGKGGKTRSTSSEIEVGAKREGHGPGHGGKRKKGGKESR
jgi:hypothetical protein